MTRLGTDAPPTTSAADAQLFTEILGGVGTAVGAGVDFYFGFPFGGRRLMQGIC